MQEEGIDAKHKCNSWPCLTPRLHFATNLLLTRSPLCLSLRYIQVNRKLPKYQAGLENKNKVEQRLLPYAVLKMGPCYLHQQSWVEVSPAFVCFFVSKSYQWILDFFLERQALGQEGVFFYFFIFLIFFHCFEQTVNFLNIFFIYTHNLHV